jgi:CubicO group peptidase (beta-lactamase class C family)
MWINGWRMLTVSMVSFVILGCVEKGMSGDLEKRVDGLVTAELQAKHIPGIAVGIFRKGEIVLAKGYGYANLEHQVPVTAATLFQSASIGKQFTAVAVMLMVEEGKLSLDTSIRQYFPDAPISWQPITVRHLLNHSSGIADYFEAMGSDGIAAFDLRRDYAPDELRHIFYRLPLSFEAGAEFYYSNTGYALLGFLVKRVSGQFYAEVLKERVFKPLEMKTARGISEEDIIANRSAGYQLLQGEVKNQEWYAPLVNTTADGSLYFSLLDYLAWDRGLRAKAILSEASWAQIYTPVKLNSGQEYPYGFGWSIHQSKAQPWYHHSGSSQGFNVYLSRHLADDITIVALTNLNGSEPWQLVDGLAEIIDPQLAKIAALDDDK